MPAEQVAVHRRGVAALFALRLGLHAERIFVMLDRLVRSLPESMLHRLRPSRVPPLLGHGQGVDADQPLRICFDVFTRIVVGQSGHRRQADEQNDC
ncbi:MAG: hypothetical protein WD151_00640 [Phycisphaeraceae bacterium]